MRCLASYLSIFGASIVLMVAGCAGKPLDGYTGERGQVSGKITLNGQPAPTGCQVAFMSAKGSYRATGVVTEGGKYSLSYSVKAGLPAVEYSVQFAPPASAASAQAADPKMASAVTPSRDQSGPIPVKYLSAATSTLKSVVKAGQNTADFDLVAEKK